MMINMNDEDAQVVEITQTLGDRLREAREAKKFSIAEVAAQLRFTKETLLFMENEQWEKLHGRAYARGYFSNYVKFLGLPEDEMLAAFNIEYKVKQSEPITPLGSKKKATIPWMAILFILVALGLTGFAYKHWLQSQSETEKNTVQEQAWPVPQDENETFDAFEESVVEPLTDRIVETPTPSNVDLNAVGDDNESNEAQGNMAEEIQELESNDIENFEPVAAEVNLPVSNDEIVLSGGVLELFSLQDCWVEVRDAESNILLYQTITKNETVTVEGSLPLNVILGSAVGVSVKFNDSLFDTTPYIQGGVAKFTLGNEF
jgi:cytoskeleton protein RodZ